jgi:hypothetical protein
VALPLGMDLDPAAGTGTSRGQPFSFSDDLVSGGASTPVFVGATREIRS